MDSLFYTYHKTPYTLLTDIYVVAVEKTIKLLNNVYKNTSNKLGGIYLFFSFFDSSASTWYDRCFCFWIFSLIKVVYSINIDNLPPPLPCSISYEDTDESHDDEYFSRKGDICKTEDMTKGYDPIHDKSVYRNKVD